MLRTLIKVVIGGSPTPWDHLILCYKHLNENNELHSKQGLALMLLNNLVANFAKLLLK